MRSRVLLVDSDPEGLAGLAQFLARHDLEVLQASSVREMDQALAEAEVDAVILDLMRPGEKGLAVCGKLRAHPSAPAVIVVSAVADEADIVVGLEIGADDYVAKPCRSRELLARLRAVLRRRGEAVSVARDRARSESYHFEGWRLSAATHQLFDPNARPIDLSPAEFNLLRVLVAKPQEVVPRSELAPGRPSGEARDFQINVAMSRLRRKLVRAEGGARLIRTVRHGGYLFTVPVERISP
ncbi:response regulator transcription factor [Caulobacter sp.]|uniref:response regulator transcription factor n=1 Tax=Caulobacter sp. TaxID=78 RepID=UPI001B10B40F|nr:response regulator transcription factor [Caulobacter sp.]MBO9544408.1 response regulator transcription factor [Caulobacter sp.]